MSWIPKKRKREWAANKCGLMRLTLNQNQNSSYEAVYCVSSLTHRSTGSLGTRRAITEAIFIQPCLCTSGIQGLAHEAAAQSNSHTSNDGELIPLGDSLFRPGQPGLLENPSSFSAQLTSLDRAHRGPSSDPGAAQVSFLPPPQALAFWKHPAVYW